MRLKVTDEAAEVIRRYAGENGISYYNDAASQIILLFDKIEATRKSACRVEIGDNRLSLYAEYLPAGTYQYTYPLRAVLPGEYRVLPTRAWVNYFPEIYAHSAGEVFSIKP